MAPIFLAGGSADQRFACQHVPSSAEQRDETSARMALSFKIGELCILKFSSR